MSKINSEEKSPLLFVVDDEAPLRSGHYEGRRFNGITAGAATVLTHFPNYISTCWMATAVSALVFFMMILLVLSTLTAVSLRVPRCAAFPDTNNSTIHLVHLNNYHHQESKSLRMIQDILELYPTYNVRILDIQEKQDQKNKIVPDGTGTEQNLKENTNVTELISTPTVSTTKREKIKRRKEIEDTQILLNMLLGARLVDMTEPVSTTLKPTTTTKKVTDTLQQLMNLFPKITYENMTYIKAFSDSPLNPHYLIMNDKLRIFAIRVLQIWQYGGISFDIESHSHNLKELTTNKHNFVISEKKNSDNSLENVVIVDEKALRLESKIPCHAFFGQILMILRKATKHTTIRHVMRSTIKTFCKHYVVNLDSCKAYVIV